MHITAKLVAVALALAPSLASAEPVQDWAAQASARITAATAAERSPRIRGSAVVTMRFVRGADGRPSGVSYAGGDTRLVALVEATLAHMAPLPPLPATIAPQTPITLHLLVGSGPRLESQGSRLAASARAHNLALARRQAEGTEVAAK